MMNKVSIARKVVKSNKGSDHAIYPRSDTYIQTNQDYVKQ